VGPQGSGGKNPNESLNKQDTVASPSQLDRRRGARTGGPTEDLRGAGKDTEGGKWYTADRRHLALGCSIMQVAALG